MGAIVFDREKVIKMGTLVEAALFNKNNSSDEINLLRYAKEFIDVRRSCLLGKDTDDLITSLKEKKISLNKNVVDIDALNMWLRGSRNNDKDALKQYEEEALYERLQQKLKD